MKSTIKNKQNLILINKKVKMKNLRIEQKNKYFLYAFLSVCCFAVVYAIGWFISLDPLWFVEMTTTARSRGALLMISVITICLCYATSMLVSDN